MIRLYLDLSYEVYNTMSQQYQKQIRFLSLIILNLSDIFVKKNQKSMLPLGLHIVRVSLEALKEKS